VESYDSATQKISAQPLIKRGYTDETGERIAERLPIITGVPVVFPGGGGYRVTFPIAKGDTVLLIFSEASLDKWLAHGGDVDPNDDRRHTLSDAIAIPGLRDFAHALDSAPTDCATIGSDSGAVIEMRTADIRIGGGSGHEPTIKATTYRAAEDTLFAAIASAIGLNIPTGGSAAATAITSAIAIFQAAVAIPGITTIAKVK
jgi:hypothetical protein